MSTSVHCASCQADLRLAERFKSELAFLNTAGFTPRWLREPGALAQAGKPLPLCDGCRTHRLHAEDRHRHQSRSLLTVGLLVLALFLVVQ